MSTAIEQYRNVSANVAQQVEDANAHRLIQMLMEGALGKLRLAKTALKANNVAEKGKNLSLAITIIDGLQSSLDKSHGAEVADNLFNLYQYMMETLLIANLQDDISAIEEVEKLMTTVKAGWDGIADEAKQILEKSPPSEQK